MKRTSRFSSAGWNTLSYLCVGVGILVAVSLVAILQKARTHVLPSERMVFLFGWLAIGFLLVCHRAWTFCRVEAGLAAIEEELAAPPRDPSQPVSVETQLKALAYDLLIAGYRVQLRLNAGRMLVFLPSRNPLTAALQPWIGRHVSISASPSEGEDVYHADGLAVDRGYALSIVAEKLGAANSPRL